jgi:Fe2+ or Zn2+ uptake regulation protein
MADNLRARGLKLTRQVEDIILPVLNEHPEEITGTDLLALAVAAQTYVLASGLSGSGTTPPTITD